MFSIIVTEKGGDQRRHEFDKSEVTIGRVQGNDVILPKGNVSKRHARIVLKDGKFIIVDLKSTNGTYVNGRKITSPLVVKENDKIYIGDFILGVEEGAGGTDVPSAPGMDAMMPPSPAPPMPPSAPPLAPPMPASSPPSPPPPISASPPAPQPVREPPPPAPAPVPAPAATPIPEPRELPRDLLDETPPPPAPPRERPPTPGPATPSPRPRLVGAGAPRPAPRASRPMPLSPRGASIDPLDPALVKMLELQADIHERLAAKLDLADVPPEELGDEDLWQRAESAIVDLVETLDSSGEIPNFIDQDALIKESLNEALGLGPLEDLLGDEDVDEILVDRRDRVLVRRRGQLTGSGKAFSSDATLRAVVERLVASTGRTIDEDTPLVDVRLRDGSRLAAAVPPVAVHSACLTLRKPSVGGHTLEELVGNGTLSPAMGDFLTTCVAARKNVLVCGAPGAGKSAVLSALAACAPDGERIVSVEEVAALQIDRDDWIALEARPGDRNGLASVGVDALLRSAMRMRPDRLVVGDVRGPEALELVCALGGSQDGALVSVAGEGAPAALARLASMARLSGGLSPSGLRELVAAGIDVVVHVARYADGQHRVASISEVTGVTDDGFAVRELFCFTSGGGFAAAGVVPGFYEELEARGIPADTSIFR